MVLAADRFLLCSFVVSRSHIFLFCFSLSPLFSVPNAGAALRVHLRVWLRADSMLRCGCNEKFHSERNGMVRPDRTAMHLRPHRCFWFGSFSTLPLLFLFLPLFIQSECYFEETGDMEWDASLALYCVAFVWMSLIVGVGISFFTFEAKIMQPTTSSLAAAVFGSLIPFGVLLPIALACVLSCFLVLLDLVFRSFGLLPRSS